jgi:hypothetical protein
MEDLKIAIPGIVDTLTSLSANLAQEAAHISALIDDPGSSKSGKSDLAYGQCQISASLLGRIQNILSVSATDITAITSVMKSHTSHKFTSHSGKIGCEAEEPKEPIEQRCRVCDRKGTDYCGCLDW